MGFFKKLQRMLGVGIGKESNDKLMKNAPWIGNYDRTDLTKSFNGEPPAKGDQRTGEESKN